VVDKLQVKNGGVNKMKYINNLFNVRNKFNEKPSDSRPVEPYVYQPEVVVMDFSESSLKIKNSGYKVVESAIDNNSPRVVSEIIGIAAKSEIDFKYYEIELDKYKTYFEQAEYLKKYPDYYRGNQVEKSLEHYLALQLLNLINEDIFIDIASENSPVPEIYSRLTGATTFSQDIMYPAGVNGNQIGGNACSMPIPDGFASKAALTCSLEHFEGKSDTELYQELSRILKPGGIVCVIPFYIFLEEATQTDPTISVPCGVVFDRNTTVYCAQGWANRHGRFYSPQSFVNRIINPVKEKFKFDFYYLKNAEIIDTSVYVRFAFTATRL